MSRALLRGYRPVLSLALRFRWVTLGTAAVILGLSLIPLSRLESEFMPRVEEGTAPLEMFETLVNLRPTSEWRPGVDHDSLVAEMDAAVRMPGVMNIWTMPIQNRIEILATGMRSPVGVQIFGDDLDEIERLGEEIEGLLHQVPGTRSAVAERGASGSYLDVVVDRREPTRYGLSVAEAQRAMMTAVGGEVATRTVAGRKRYAVQVRYPRELRQSSRARGRTW